MSIMVPSAQHLATTATIFLTYYCSQIAYRNHEFYMGKDEYLDYERLMLLAHRCIVKCANERYKKHGDYYPPLTYLPTPKLSFAQLNTEQMTWGGLAQMHSCVVFIRYQFEGGYGYEASWKIVDKYLKLLEEYTTRILNNAALGRSVWGL